MVVEMAEAARMGLRTGLLMLRGPIIRHPFPVHPQIRRLLEDGAVERIDPNQALSARLVLVHHPSVLEHPLAPRPRILAGQLIIVLHHPARDAAGAVQYDLSTVLRHARMGFDLGADTGADTRSAIWLAPVSAVVRHGLSAPLPQGAQLLPDDWTNLIDLADWPPRPPRQSAQADRLVLGRHARPDRRKWPDTAAEAFAAWPTPPGWRLRALGADAELLADYGPLPAAWDLLPFNAEPVAEYLHSVDVWVYFHASAWSEAFGRATLETMACGVPVVLAPLFRPLFGEAALYCTPAEVEPLLRRLAQDPLFWAERAAAGRRFAETTHAAGLFAARITPLLDAGANALTADTPAPHISLPPLPDAKVLFLSSNGIGMGHLVQQMAIAERLAPGLVPVFATMSYAAQLTRKAGLATEFLPGHRNGGLDPSDWNPQFAEHLLELLIRLRPRVVMYDATAVFEGVIAALHSYAEAFTVWVRRPMWQECHRVFLPALWEFDAVIEPGELAEALDTGPTLEQRNMVLPVPPVLHVDPGARLTSAAARRALDLPEAATVVAVQLGGGNNYPLGDLRSRLLADLLARPGLIVLEITAPIAVTGPAPQPLAENHRILPLFPLFRYSRGFDAMVSAAGYNAFHELVLGGVPTLFVPNEGPEMDMQVNRAIWADLAGLALICRRDRHQPLLSQLLDRLLSPAEAAAMRRRMAALPRAPNGAQAIADYVEDHARLIRADRPAGLQA